MRDDSTPHDADTLKVQADNRNGLYLPVSRTQVPQIQVLFDGMAISYTIESADSEISRFVFDAKSTADEIQSLLDGMY
jgi:hypothetical protein